MQPETVKLIIDMLKQLANQGQDYGVKLLAMERVLQRYPQVHSEYQRELNSLNHDPAIVANYQGISQILTTLQAKLLRD